jgi:signal transduction histidine kinase
VVQTRSARPGGGLRALAEELRVNTLVRPTLEVDAGAEGLLGPDAAAGLLQIAREAASNVIRHARASEVTIRLAQAEGQVVLAVRDNGRGFEPASAEERAGPARAGGEGLRNMAARAKLLGGRLAVVSGPGRGTEVRLEVPLREAAAV